MSVETPEELEQLRAAGRVVALAIRAMRAAAGPGVATSELDEVGARVLRRFGARSGPQLDYGFPGVTCLSVKTRRPTASRAGAGCGTETCSRST